MAIKGLTDQTATSEDGHLPLLGIISKGEREGFGHNVKLKDLDYLRFTPIGNDEKQKEAMTDYFIRAYGEKPKVIDDVRLPWAYAANFKIEDCAWLVAQKHTEKGSTFLASSNGEYIRRLRSEETGRVGKYICEPDQHAPEDEVIPHDKITVRKGDKDGIMYKGKFYPWAQQMKIDLILPKFNRYLYENGVAGHGVVRLITHSTYDIARLISEYRGILREIANGLGNPIAAPHQTGSIEWFKSYAPLRSIPLRLERTEDKITTPNWRDKENGAGERLQSTRHLLHLRLSPTYALSMQKALDTRTQNMLAAVANAPLLQAGIPTISNDDLFGDGIGDVKALPAPNTPDIPQPPAERHLDGSDDDIIDSSYTYEELERDTAQADYESAAKKLRETTGVTFAIVNTAIRRAIHVDNAEAYKLIKTWPNFTNAYSKATANKRVDNENATALMLFEWACREHAPLSPSTARAAVHALHDETLTDIDIDSRETLHTVIDKLIGGDSHSATVIPQYFFGKYVDEMNEGEVKAILAWYYHNQYMAKREVVAILKGMSE